MTTHQQPEASDDAVTSRIHIPQQAGGQTPPPWGPQQQQTPTPQPPKRRRRWPWVLAGGIVVAVLAVAIVGGINTSSSAAKMCTALDQGQVPYTAFMQTYQPQQGQGTTALRQAASDVRATCPSHNDVADTMGTLADMSEGRYSFAPGATSASRAAVPAAVDTTTTAPAPRRYELTVSGSAKRATVYYGVAGSSGGGDTVSVPWSKTMSDQGGSYSTATLSATTSMGAKGDLTCSIADADTHEVLDTKNAKSQGGSYGYASVICSSTN